MQFSAAHVRENDFRLVRLQDNETGTKVSILPQYGALLHAFEFPLNGSSFNLIDNYQNKAELEQYLDLSFKSSKLSPFVCRLRNGKYQVHDVELEITKKFPDGTAIHGLLYNKSFHVLNLFADDHSASATLRYHYKKDDPGYPFHYVCEVKYALHPLHRLQVETTIMNLDDHEIPLADGWHPYFRLGGVVDDYELQFSSGAMVEFDDRLIPTGRLITNTTFNVPTRLGSRQLDNCFLLQFREGLPCCKLRNPENQAAISFFTDTGYSYLQIYTPDHRKSIAMENLSSAPDCFNNGMGLMLLPPRRAETFTIWYQLSVG